MFLLQEPEQHYSLQQKLQQHIQILHISLVELSMKLPNLVHLGVDFAITFALAGTLELLLGIVKARQAGGGGGGRNAYLEAELLLQTQ